MEKRKYGALSSSANPEELSLTVTSIVRMLGLVVTAFASFKGVDIVITDAQAQAISATVITIVTALFTIKEGSSLIYGIFRKIAAQFGDK